MLLKNSKALEKIATENANLFVRIGKAIKEFIAKLRKAQKDMYEDVGELHDAAVRLRETLKSFEELQSIFDEALTNSIRNMRNALAEAENAETRANLDVLEKAAEDEDLRLSEEIDEKLTNSSLNDYNEFGNIKSNNTSGGYVDEGKAISKRHGSSHDIGRRNERDSSDYENSGVGSE